MDARSSTSFDSSVLPMWIHHGVHGRVLAANGALVALCGWSAEELTALTVDALVVVADRARLFQDNHGAQLIAGASLRRRDAPPLDVKLNVQHFDSDGSPAFLVLAVDGSDEAIREWRLLTEARADAGSFEWEIDTNRVHWSDELYRMYGISPQQFEATYEGFLERIHPDDRANVDVAIRRCVTTGVPFHLEERILRTDGSVGILETRGWRLAGARRLVGMCRDITELRAVEREREELARRDRDARVIAETAHAGMREILERIADAFIALDPDWNYTYVNRRAAEIFGHDREWYTGRNIWTEFPEGKDKAFHRMLEKAMATQQPQAIEDYYAAADKWFENRIYPSSKGLAIYFQDVTERHRREDELRETRDRLTRTEEFSLVMATQIAIDGTWLRVPSTLCSLLGYAADELLSRNAEEIIHPDDLENDRMHRQRIVDGETRSEDVELRLVRKDGSPLWMYLNCSGVYDAGGRLSHFMVYMRDITERRRAEERIRYQALHDELTELPNRVLFNDRLGQAVAHAQRHDGKAAVILVDLDKFKLVNDNFGHSFGDVVIRDVAGRLRSSLRASDTVARLGGDEFVIIAPEISGEDRALVIAETVRRAIADPFEVNNHQVGLTVSIGISIYPRDGHDPEMLLRSAESALNRAKETGGDSVLLFDQSMSGRFRDRLAREQELRGALQDRQLVVYYQPILRSVDQRVEAVEALLRWNHPRRGLVGPDEFIPLAEETRLIVPVGEYVLERACSEVGRLKNGSALRLSVNLSARQFQEITLLQTVDRILQETAFDPADLELEVTESVAMQNADFTMNLLRDLRRRKISIAIDDFGAGHSSLIYLRQFPINNIKIDKVFISDMLTDPTDAAIVRAVINLAHTLGVTTTAEGVETREQMQMLQEFGCDLLQGYYISRPVPAAGLAEFLARV